MLQPPKRFSGGRSRARAGCRRIAAFYCATIIELGIEKAPLNKDGERTPMTMSGVAELTRPFRDAAKQCRASLAAPGRPGVDRNLARSLENCAEFFDEEADFIVRVNAQSAYCLSRSSRDRNDDNVRTKVRALAKNNQLIFGECMYQTLATMAFSLLGSKAPSSGAVVLFHSVSGIPRRSRAV
jgi:hypothetical protein